MHGTTDLPFNADITITQTHHPTTDEANGARSHNQRKVSSAETSPRTVYFTILSPSSSVPPSTTTSAPTPEALSTLT